MCFELAPKRMQAVVSFTNYSHRQDKQPNTTTVSLPHTKEYKQNEVSFKVNRSRSRLRRRQRRRREPLSVVCRARAWRPEETPCSKHFSHWRHVVCSLQSGDSGARNQLWGVCDSVHSAVVSVRLRRTGNYRHRQLPPPHGSRRVANNCDSCFMMAPSRYSSPILRTPCLPCWHASCSDYTPTYNWAVFHTHVHFTLFLSLIRCRRILRHSHLSLGLILGRPSYYFIWQPILPGSTCKCDSALTWDLPTERHATTKEWGWLLHWRRFCHVGGLLMGRETFYIHTFIIEWQHKHAGFKTKHNAQSISQ